MTSLIDQIKTDKCEKRRKFELQTQKKQIMEWKFFVFLFKKIFFSLNACC